MRKKKIVKLALKIIEGNYKKYGMQSCIDKYYTGCWDKDIKKLKKQSK